MEILRAVIICFLCQFEFSDICGFQKRNTGLWKKHFFINIIEYYF